MTEPEHNPKDPKILISIRKLIAERKALVKKVEQVSTSMRESKEARIKAMEESPKVGDG